MKPTNGRRDGSRITIFVVGIIGEVYEVVHKMFEGECTEQQETSGGGSGGVAAAVTAAEMRSGDERVPVFGNAAALEKIFCG